MTVDYAAAFHKDLKQINDANLLAKVLKAVDQVKAAKSVFEIPNLKKLKGWDALYRIRLGDYRITVEIVSNVATFVHFRHRSDIYK